MNNVYAVENNDKLSRLSGNDIYSTAITVSQNGWKTSIYAVLARGDDYADALCAGPLAKKLGAPILLTKPNELRSDVLNELKRLNVQNVIIIGGEGAIQARILASLEAAGIADVQRIYGSNRYETSIKIAERLGNVDKVAITTGLNSPDALSISAVAAKSGMPILLTEKNNLPETVRQYFIGKQINKTYVTVELVL
jgi:putative cell wall-binding protein